MNEIKDLNLLPIELQEQSLSKTDLTFDYYNSIQVLDVFKEKGYAALGFEMLHKQNGEMKELKHYICYFPDHIIWEDFIESSFEQVRDNLSKEFLELRYSDLNEDDIYFSLTFVNQEEFEVYYYEYIQLD